MSEATEPRELHAAVLALRRRGWRVYRLRDKHRLSPPTGPGIVVTTDHLLAIAKEERP